MSIVKCLITVLIIFLPFCNTIAGCKGHFTLISPSGKSYNVEMKFYTGYELNNLTNSHDYDNYEGYAVVFWGEGQATIIKITFTGQTFTPFHNTYTCDMITLYKNVLPNTPMEGYDQYNDKWKIVL